MFYYNRATKRNRYLTSTCSCCGYLDHQKYKTFRILVVKMLTSTSSTTLTFNTTNTNKPNTCLCLVCSSLAGLPHKVAELQRRLEAARRRTDKVSHAQETPSYLRTLEIGRRKPLPTVDTDFCSGLQTSTLCFGSSHFYFVEHCDNEVWHVGGTPHSY